MIFNQVDSGVIIYEKLDKDDQTKCDDLWKVKISFANSVAQKYVNNTDI